MFSPSYFSSFALRQIFCISVKNPPKTHENINKIVTCYVHALIDPQTQNSFSFSLLH